MYACTCTQIIVNICTHVYIYSCVSTFVYMYVHMYTYIFTHLFIHIYINTFVYTHRGIIFSYPRSLSHFDTLSLYLPLSLLHVRSLFHFVPLSTPHPRPHVFLSPSPPLSRCRSPSHSLTDIHTHTHTHDTRGAAWVQVLCKEGGMPLIMCVQKDGASCLMVAAENGHTAVVEVGAGGGRQREAGGRVSAATAHGTWCRGCRQHAAPRCNVRRHTVAV